ncbi:MAG TPA: glycosyltransferase family 2 protein [Clostridiaceae bacterium]|nr:glycosyltransferase family 2 protein [Clostridiaceae bacterium]
MKILVIIPAYNEEASIGAVISQIKHSTPEADIVVVNDGSKDNTSSRAREAGAVVIDLPFNLGIGGAMQTGYKYAAQNNYDIAVQVDGDGQHDPSYIKTLMQPVLENRADMAIGSRYVSKTGYKSPLLRRTGMLFFSTLVSLLTGQHVKDTTSGFRVVNKKIIKFFAENYPTDYPEVDVLVRLHRKNFRIIEIPVEMHERQGGKSSITAIRSIYYMIKVSLSLIIGSIRSADSKTAEE